ncbi:hypothetical protein AURDEDRAFT_177104, partial [Auricularia subglabra TFB-10046 SS5]
ISGEELTASRELELYDPFDACEMHIAPDAGNRFEDRISRGCGEPLVSRSSSGEELDPGKEHGEREESAAGDGGPRPVPTAAEVFVRNMVDNYAVEWVFVVSQASPRVRRAILTSEAIVIFIGPLLLPMGALLGAYFRSYLLVPCTVLCVGLITFLFHKFRSSPRPSST